MPDQLLTILKYVFLALLYLFFVRVVRAVWAELREPALGNASGPLPGYLDPPRGDTTRGRRRQAHLVVVDPAEDRGQTFDLADELTLGRAPACGVPLVEDTFASQLHARLFRREGKVFVEDLGSTNGTYLNEQPVSGPVEIRRGDRLQVGRTILELTK